MNQPTFYEKKAFAKTFRKKWKYYHTNTINIYIYREGKGLCSLFDKRKLYKEALEKKQNEQVMKGSHGVGI